MIEAKILKFGRTSLTVGSVTEEQEFVKLIVAGGYKGNTKKAWISYKKSLPTKKKAASKPKKEESSKEK